MNHRLTIAAAVAVILASVSEYVLINGASWLAFSIGAVIVAAGAGTITRLARTYSTIGATVLAVIAGAPLLVDRSLLLKVAGVAIIGCCAASASWLRALKLTADIVTYLAALLLYFNLAFSAASSWLFVIPTGKSLRHLVVLVNYGSTATKSPPPVSGTAGVILLVAVGIGLAAVVVDLIAVRLNRPAIAGLPLLVLYMAPIATTARPSGASNVITFLLAAAGYLGLLASDGRKRLRDWGRIITVWHYSGEDDKLGGADMRGLAATGRRIGVAAVCAAIVSPLLLPTLNLHRLFTHDNGGPPIAGAMLPDPVDQMHVLLSDNKSVPVLSYRSSGADAGQYLQVYVLNYVPSASEWQTVNPKPAITVGQGPLLKPPGLAPAISVEQTTTTITLDHLVGASTRYPFAAFLLPVPYWPTRLRVFGSWNESDGSLMIYSGVADQSGLRYTVKNGQPVLTKANEEAADAAPIPGSISRTYGQFQSPVSARLTRIARQITEGDDTRFAKAVALESYFQSSRFTYALQAPDLQDNARGLLTFLTTDPRGNCEQFAFAMAALARLVGIPSRIAIGYTQGTDHQGTWDVTTHDMHAWPELYFPTLGWLRFEPTPGGPDGQGTATQPSYAVPGGPGIKVTTPPVSKGQKSGSSSPGGRSGRGQRRFLGEPGSYGGQPLAHKAGSLAPVDQILLAVLTLLIVAAAVPGIARVVVRRRRWRAAESDTALAQAAWQEICADLEDFGLTHPLSESPRAMARRISADTKIDESARQAIGRIATVVERCRYAPVPASAGGIRADVAQVRRSLARSATMMQRWQARIAPASVVGPAISSVSRNVGQRTGWVTAAGS